MVRKEDPARCRADVMARSADPLQPAGHRGWSFDLNHDIDGTHIDPELQRRCAQQRMAAGRS